MPDFIDKVLRSFPPRPVTDGERQLLLDWIDTAEDFSAVVSERRSDDPAIYRRIVISRRATNRCLYFIHSPQHSDCWIMISAEDGQDVGRFPTLLAALNYIHHSPFRGAHRRMSARMA